MDQDDWHGEDGNPDEDQERDTEIRPDPQARGALDFPPEGEASDETRRRDDTVPELDDSGDLDDRTSER